jgi:hypothetical protein
MNNQAPFERHNFNGSAFESYLQATGRAWYKMNTSEQARAVKEYRAEAERKQQRDRDLVSANRQVCATREAIAAYEREYSDCPEELPGGYFRALQSLQEWENEVKQLRQQA